MRRRTENFPDNGFEAWGGYMNAKIAKLEEQFSDRTNKEENLISNIFNGVSIYVNGYTIPSADELKTLMSKHGGVYHTYQRSNDYVIAFNLPDTKVKKMSLNKVVKPEWIIDSIASNKLLDFRDYLLFRTSKTQPLLSFNNLSKNTLLEVKPIEKCLLQQDIHLEKIESVSPNEIQLKEETSKYLSNPLCCNNVFENMPLEVKPNVNIKYCNDNCLLPQDIHLRKSEPVSPNQIKFNEETLKCLNNPSSKTAADPNFISEFYSNSRLHHISQLSASFKQYVNDLRDQSDFKFPLRTTLKNKILQSCNSTVNLSPIMFEKGKTIMHIDMDCFFVSVGLRTRPHLKGLPVAVTHSKGGHPQLKRSGVNRNAEFNLYKQKQAIKISKPMGLPIKDEEFESPVGNITEEGDTYGSMSEIASCSYEARAKGVSNGMFMGAALKLCPDLQPIPYDFEGYKEVAYMLYDTIAQYTLDIEAVSCDEMFVDCTDLLKDLNINVQDFAIAIRDEIKNKTGCPCSTGFGGNRLQARLATKKAKPDGQFFLSAELVGDFMFNIKLRDLPGVGRQTSLKLESLGHSSCGSLQSMSLVTLKLHLGNKTGPQLFQQCRGQDPNPLIFHTVRKSVSAEVNYGIRFENEKQCEEFLKQLSMEVQSRMTHVKVKGKCITLKLMVRAENAPVETAKFMGHGYCNVINKSVLIHVATNDADIISKEVISLWKKQKVDPIEMRGIGIQITKLESTIVKNKGTINKYLQSKLVKIDKHEEKHNIITNDNFNDKKGKLNVKKTEYYQYISLVTKSPTKNRGRGRPPKNILLKPQHSNLMSKFLQGQNSVSSIDSPFKNPFINPNPTVLQKNEKPHGLLDLPWKQVREMLRAWLESGQMPLACDINMIAAYMREMVINKNIDNLYILLRFLRRRTSELGSDWNDVYDQIMDHVQNAMIAVYGKTLIMTQ